MFYGFSAKKDQKRGSRTDKEGTLKLKINIYYLVLINRLKSCERGLPFVILDYIFRSYFFDNHMLNSELLQENNNEIENKKPKKNSI